MTCPNCGLENAAGAKFCANCGTVLGAAPAQPNNAYQGQSQSPGGLPPYQQAGPYNRSPAGSGSGNSMTKNIALGCLIFLAIFMFLGLSCTRACFRGRHHTYVYRR